MFVPDFDTLAAITDHRSRPCVVYYFGVSTSAGSKPHDLYPRANLVVWNRHQATVTKGFIDRYRNHHVGSRCLFAMWTCPRPEELTSLPPDIP